MPPCIKEEHLTALVDHLTDIRVLALEADAHDTKLAGQSIVWDAHIQHHHRSVVPFKTVVLKPATVEYNVVEIDVHT